MDITETLDFSHMDPKSMNHQQREIFSLQVNRDALQKSIEEREARGEKSGRVYIDETRAMNAMDARILELETALQSSLPPQGNSVPNIR